MLKVEICLGTTCYVLGASKLANLETQLPADLQDKVEVVGSPCLGVCRDRNYGNAPFVRVGSTMVEQATVQKIIEVIYQEIAG